MTLSAEIPFRIVQGDCLFSICSTQLLFRTASLQLSSPLDTFSPDYKLRCFTLLGIRNGSVLPIFQAAAQAKPSSLPLQCPNPRTDPSTVHPKTPVGGRTRRKTAGVGPSPEAQEKSPRGRKRRLLGTRLKIEVCVCVGYVPPCCLLGEIDYRDLVVSVVEIRVRCRRR